MMTSSLQLRPDLGERRRLLIAAAQAVRQSATRDGDDLIGWRLSRLMREAETDAQVDLAERKYADWQRMIGASGMAASGIARRNVCIGLDAARLARS